MSPSVKKIIGVAATVIFTVLAVVLKEDIKPVICGTESPAAVE